MTTTSNRSMWRSFSQFSIENSHFRIHFHSSSHQIRFEYIYISLSENDSIHTTFHHRGAGRACPILYFQLKFISKIPAYHLVGTFEYRGSSIINLVCVLWSRHFQLIIIIIQRVYRINGGCRTAKLKHLINLSIIHISITMTHFPRWPRSAVTV